jgi:hypothetical protein
VTLEQVQVSDAADAAAASAAPKSSKAATRGKVISLYVGVGERGTGGTLPSVFRR